jgi:hypothetical protein
MMMVMIPDETLTRKSENSSVSATRARQTARKWASAWFDEAVLLICMRHRWATSHRKKDNKQINKQKKELKETQTKSDRLFMSIHTESEFSPTKIEKRLKKKKKQTSKGSPNKSSAQVKSNLLGLCNFVGCLSMLDHVRIRKKKTAGGSITHTRQTEMDEVHIKSQAITCVDKECASSCCHTAALLLLLMRQFFVLLSFPFFFLFF